MDIFEQIEKTFLDLLQPGWYTNLDDNTLAVDGYQPYESNSQQWQEGDYVFTYTCTDRSDEGTLTLHNDNRLETLQEAATLHSSILNTAPLVAPSPPVMYKTFGKIIERDGAYCTMEIERTEEIPLHYENGIMEVTSYQEARDFEINEQEQQNTLEVTNNNEIQEEIYAPEETVHSEEGQEEQQDLEEEEPFLDIDYAARGRRRMKQELIDRQAHSFHNPKENYTPPSFQLHRPPNHKEKSRHSNNFKQEQSQNPKMEQLLMEKELLQHLMKEEKGQTTKEQTFTAPQIDTPSLETLDNYTLDLELEPENFDREEPELELDIEASEDDKEQDVELSQGY